MGVLSRTTMGQSPAYPSFFTMIYYDRVSKIYPDNSVALEDVSFSVEPGEFISIVGHSGAGKTTLVKMLLAEEKPTNGAVFFESVNIHEVPLQQANNN